MNGPTSLATHLLTLAVLGAATGAVTWAAAQESPPEQAPAAEVTPAAPTQGFHVGTASCASDLCHGSPRPRSVYGIRQDEFYLWLRDDPHAEAAAVLNDPRSRRIAQNLGLSESPTTSAACVGCHAPATPAVGARWAGRPAPEEGVTCESCHGPASGWRDSHTAPDWTREQGVRQGLVPLWDPVARAGVCLDCHGGAPGRVVDHDLLAAGHPELTFELDNYSRSVSHWLPWEERPRERRTERPNHGARAWAVGQAAAFRRATAEVARRASSGRWPDFSFLGCTSCHHDLAEERWRTEDLAGDPFTARTGLPPWSPAPWAGLRPLVATHAPGELAALDGLVTRLARQLSGLTTPPDQVAATARELEARLAPLAQRLDSVAWTSAAVEETLSALAADSRALAAADSASAQQAALAAHALIGDLLDRLDPPDRRRVLEASADDLAAVTAQLRDRHRLDRDRFREALARLGPEDPAP